MVKISKHMRQRPTLRVTKTIYVNLIEVQFRVNSLTEKKKITKSTFVKCVRIDLFAHVLN